MNAFYYKHIPIADLHLLAAHFTFACDKIKNRQLYFFTRQKPLQIFIQFFDIQCLKTFKIRFSVLIKRCIFPIYKIIIYRNRVWFQSMSPQLNG